MTNFLSLLRKRTEYRSSRWHESVSFPGTRFAVRQVSLQGRIALMQGMSTLIAQNEFLRAGDALERSDASVADLLAKRLYIEWGLEEISGLHIDGRPADPKTLIDKGPEPLCEEIVSVIRASLELSEAERKNF